ncbi:MAG: hypothetical protein ACYTGQ_05405 [Planctomycetota bacterium]|jgi:hypothetical protein
MIAPTHVIVFFAAIAITMAPGCATDHVTPHPLTIGNPAAMIPASNDQTLFARTNAIGAPRDYHMDVQSVFCYKDLCEIIAVRLHWDPLGRYLRYETHPDQTLTKHDHRPFTAADHKLLHELLSDPRSVIGRVQAKELMAAELENATPGSAAYQFLWRNPEYVIEGDAKADATSSPTPVDLQAHVVHGAAYTCVTLWHWTHGEIPQHIQRVTRDTARHTQLVHWLNHDDPGAARFAIETLTHRNTTDHATRQAVLKRCLRGDTALLRTAWAYLNTPPHADTYAYLLEHGAAGHRVLTLEQLGAANDLSAPLFVQLAQHLHRFESYYEFNLFLDLLERNSIRDPQINRALAAQLQRPDAFITRRIQDYLNQ